MEGRLIRMITRSRIRMRLSINQCSWTQRIASRRMGVGLKRPVGRLKRRILRLERPRREKKIRDMPNYLLLSEKISSRQLAPESLISHLPVENPLPTSKSNPNPSALAQAWPTLMSTPESLNSSQENTPSTSETTNPQTGPSNASATTSGNGTCWRTASHLVKKMELR